MRIPDGHGKWFGTLLVALLLPCGVSINLWSIIIINIWYTIAGIQKRYQRSTWKLQSITNNKYIQENLPSISARKMQNLRATSFGLIAWRSLTSPQTCFSCSCNFFIFASDFWMSSLWLALDAFKASRVFFSCANISRSVWILEYSISRRLSCCKDEMSRLNGGSSERYFHKYSRPPEEEP